MINRVTGEIRFSDNFLIFPHCSLNSLSATAQPLKVVTHKLSLGAWKRHVLGSRTSEHGIFLIEALSAEEDCVDVVLLSHNHPFYESGTPEDADRRAFHEGVISADLGGQREFAWGEVICRLEVSANRDWMVIAYNRQPRVPYPGKRDLLELLAHERTPEEN
jgi:hypothetical protein